MSDDIPIFRSTGPDPQVRKHGNSVRPAASPDNMDIDRQMWTFYTPTPPVAAPERPIDALPQQDRINVPAQKALPKRRPPFYPMFGERICPPYQCPGVWGRPVHQVGADCLGFYETEYTLLSFMVPDTRLLLVESVGYELENTLPVGEIFTIRVRRNGETLAEWQDIVGANTPNPVQRYAFGSFLNPVPFRLRIDRTQNITISIVLNGPLPFVKTSADPADINAKAILYGYLDQLRDTREGGFRPRVAGTERGQDKWDHIPHNVANFMAAMPQLNPYFTEKFDGEDMEEFYAQMGTMGGAINVE